MRTNEQRAQRAFRAILASGYLEGDEEEAVTDLLTDLRHMGDQHYGWTLDELVERSRMHYDAEAAENT